MNKLINELGVIANRYALTESKTEENKCLVGSDYFLWLERKKFTELVIQECCSILEQNAEFVNNQDAWEAFLHGASQIKEHFGVEE